MPLASATPPLTAVKATFAPATTRPTFTSCAAFTLTAAPTLVIKLPEAMVTLPAPDSRSSVPLPVPIVD